MPSNALASGRLLRGALLADAAASGAMGLLMAGGAGLLAAPLGLPEPLLRIAGLVLLPWAGWVAWLGAAALPARNAVRAVVAVNLIWVADSLLLLACGRLFGVAPGALGIAFVLVQALAVLGFALLQGMALRRASPAAIA